MMAVVLMHVMMTGARLDGMKLVNKPVMFPQPHFHREMLV